MLEKQIVACVVLAMGTSNSLSWGITLGWCLSFVDYSTIQNHRHDNLVMLLYKYERCGSLISTLTAKAPNRLETVAYNEE